MPYYINKDAVIGKIESIKNETNYEPFTDEVFGKRLVCDEIRDFIDTLEEKSFADTIKTKKDLEKEAMAFVKTKDFISNQNPVTALVVHFFELGKAHKDLTLSNYDKAMITTITNALNYLEELNDSKGHDNVPSQYQSEKDWLESLKQRVTWKPSDEQIRALRWVLNNIPYNKHKEEISGLLEQIKDL